MKDVPKYVVVIPQPDGSLYPLKFHSDYDEAVITANNHDASGSKFKAQIRSDGPEVWKAFEERERQEKNASPGTKPSESTALTLDLLSEIEAGIAEGDKLLGPDEEESNIVNVDQVSPETKVRLDNLRRGYTQVTEFAERLELAYGDEVSSTYQFIPNEPVRPCGFLFFAPPDAYLLSIKVNGQEQLMVTSEKGISTRSFLNSYGTYEALLHWVAHKVKLQYTNLPLPTMTLGSKIEVIVDKPCTICVCGIRGDAL